MWRTIGAIKSEVRCQLLLSVFNTKSLQCDSDCFNVIRTDSMWFSRFSMTQQIQYDSADSVWFNGFRMNQFNSKWFSLIKRDFSCMRRKPRPSMQPNIITYADFRIDKVLRKSVIWLQRFFCWNAPRKRSRTRGCLSQKLFTYGKVNFGELLRCDIPQSRVFTLAGNFARRLTYPVCAARAPIGAARLDYI